MKRTQLNTFSLIIKAISLVTIIMMIHGCGSSTSNKNESLDKLNDIRGVSESMAQSKKFGLLIHELSCLPKHIILGDSVDIDVEEAYLEKQWRCGPNCQSVASLKDSEDNAQVVMKCTQTSKIGNLNLFWILAPNITPEGLEKSFSETGNNGLISYNINPTIPFPLKYKIFKEDIYHHRSLIDSLTFIKKIN